MKRTVQRVLSAAFFFIYQWAWAIAIIALCFSYTAGQMLASAGGETKILENYFYWWVSTSTTLGYGEITPSNTLGQSAAMLVVIIGLGVLPVVLAKFVGVIFIMVDKKLHGTGAFHGEGHTIIFGYHPEDTEKFVAEIFSNNPKATVVLVDNDIEKNPFPLGKVEFVHGQMASQDVFERCIAKYAAEAIVHGDHDDETFFAAYCFRKQNTHARMVCYLRDKEHHDKITKDLPADDPSLNQVILPVNLYLMAQELQDPESSQVFQHLLSNLEGANHYRLDVPESLDTEMTFGEVFTHMKTAYDAIAIALKGEEVHSNPKLSDPVRPGDAVSYIADERLNNVDWNAIATRPAA